MHDKLNWYIEEVIPANEDGMVRVFLSKRGPKPHGNAIEIIGAGYDEALNRAMFIRKELNSEGID